MKSKDPKILDFNSLKNNFKNTIGEISKSDNDSFIESDIEITNFDKVKDIYYSNKKLKEAPSSNDGLYINSNKKMIFIEFKNANADSIKEYDLGKKNYDSVCMLSDILDESIREIREKTKYILVYSFEKNSKINLGDVLKRKSKDLEKNLESKKKSCFGQKKFLNYLYYDVEALNDKEFKEEYLDKEIV